MSNSTNLELSHGLDEGIGGTLLKRNSIVKVEDTSYTDEEGNRVEVPTDVRWVEVLVRNEEKLVFVPHAVRCFIYGDLDVSGLFEEGIRKNEVIRPSTLERKLMKEEVSISLVDLCCKLERIEGAFKDWSKANKVENLDRFILRNLARLITILKEGLSDLLSSSTKGLDSELTFYELRAFLNQKGKIFVVFPKGQPLAMRCTVADINRSMFTEYMYLKGAILTRQDVMTPSDYYEIFMSYPGKKTLREVGVALLDDVPDIKERLIERGKKYAHLTKAPSYLMYSGNITRKSYNREFKFKATGRVMVDYMAMTITDPDYSKYIGNSEYGIRSESDAKATIDKEQSYTNEQYALMPPYVYGFAFSPKVWGEMLVDNLSDITFRDSSFDKLVLDPERKEMIYSLVDQSEKMERDFIDGKGGGIIFLLKGTPGTGKTLTAETIAERLKRPLYMVGVGELGTEVSELEEKLRNILEVAKSWNAVLLIDECDIFMEKRTNMDIHRNAMVGVFLRLLEYYDGVLFLTTNRAGDIDQAFYSRISMVIHYDALDEEAREKVWKNLFELYGITGVDVKTLSKFSINGRRIKNVCRISLALARAKGELPKTETFVKVINENSGNGSEEDS